MVRVVTRRKKGHTARRGGVPHVLGNVQTQTQHILVEGHDAIGVGDLETNGTDAGCWMRGALYHGVPRCGTVSRLWTRASNSASGRARSTGSATGPAGFSPVAQ